MTSKNEPAIPDPQHSFQELSQAAQILNSATDKLANLVAELDFGLKNLNLGITCWVDMARSYSDDGLESWSKELGYAKVSGKWGVALRQSYTNDRYDDFNSNEWLFNDGPRDMRIQAIDCIPKLLQELIKTTEAATEEVNSKLDQAREYASAVKKIPKQT